MEEKFSFILFLITILDLYLNYDNNEFPEYHKARIYSDIFSLLTIFLPLLLVVLICCMGCLIYFKLFNNDIAQNCTYFITIIFILSIIIFAIISIFYQMHSIYIYLQYNGSKKITSMIIKLLMWISFINIIIKLFFVICDFISSLKNKQKQNEEKIFELENKEEDRI